ncbi:MAG: thiamine-phosphate kinase [Thermoanaerobaculia bacterium]
MNEFEFIEHLRGQANSRKHSPRVINGIGDDCSVISQSANRDLLVTTDLLVEGIDFHRHATPARLLGHKALAVSLSDIAAMGGRPFWSFLSIGMPQDEWNGAFKDEFYEGFFALADHFGVTLAGGDISATKEGIVIDSIVLGEVASGAAVRRSGAQLGDQIYVTGNLGGAATGLKLIELGARVGERSVPALARESSEQTAIQTLLLRQLRPQPRVGWGIVLGEQQIASAMIDLSDGLSSDLNHLCKESNAGALIDAASIPLDEDVRHLCGRRALDPLALALHGGEDFELLFTVNPENVPRLPKKVDGVLITRIGEITANAGSIRIREKNHEWDLQPQGFEHFSSEK